VAQPALEEILVYEDGAAGAPKVVSEAHEPRVVIVLVAETEKHSDSTVSSHYVVQAQLHKTLCVILSHLDAWALEQVEVWVETTGSQLFDVRVHQFRQVVIDPLEKEMGLIILAATDVPVAHAGYNNGVAKIFDGLRSQDGKLFVHYFSLS
jgi:hypothetical protein